MSSQTPHDRRSRRAAYRRPLRALTGTLVTALVFGALGSAPAVAAPDGSDVVISEVYARGGSANQPFVTKFVELYNPTTADIDVAGMSVQYRSATGTAASTAVVPLSGSVPAGGHYLVAGASNGSTGEALPAPDASGGGLHLSGTSGTVALVRGITAVTLPTGDVTLSSGSPIVDLVGYGSSNTFEGSGPAPSTGGNSVPQAIVREASGLDSDVNAIDFTTVDTPTPTNSAGETAGGGGEEEPGGGETPSADTHTIAEIQGTGESTPLAGQRVTTSGVVTAVYASGGFNGYYLQTAGSGGDADPSARTASDGIFVYAGSASRAGEVSIGDHVRVTGEAAEYYSLTQVSITNGAHTVLAEPAAPPLPIVDFELPSTDAGREVFEGMLVSPKADAYVVSDTYNLGGWGSTAYGSIGLGFNGPLLQESDVAEPGTPAFDAAVAENIARAITLDDGQSQQTGTGAKVPYLTGNPDIRTGASLTFDEPVVLDFRFQWNFQPTSPVNGAADWLRATGGQTQAANAVPTEVGGDLSLATFNVLNYFTTLGADVSGCQPYRDRAGAPLTVSGGCEPRGAWNQENLERQEAKIVAAINGLGADVVVLEEIENSAKMPGRTHQDEALEDLIDALNAAAGERTWAFVPWPADGPALSEQDVIRTAIIYRAETVQTAGEAGILVGSAAFGNAREPFAAALASTANPDYRFVVVGNHFKSKGGSCGTPAPVEGCFNADRERQATALTAFAEGYATANRADDIFLIGDFNSYSQESPVKVIEREGFENLTARSGEQSYVFDGKVGSLDHIFGNPSAASRVTGVDVWQINANESVLAEYSRYNYFASEHFQTGSVFRASDHNPGIVGIDVPGVHDGKSLDTVLESLTVELSGDEGLNGWYRSPVAISFAGLDELPEGLELEYRTVEEGEEGAEAEWSAAVEPITVEENGAQRVEYRVSEGTSASRAEAVAVRIDRVAPLVNASLTARKLSFVGLDAHSGVDRIEYRVDHGGWNAYDAPIAFDEFGHRVEVRAVDRAGTESALRAIVVPGTVAQGLLGLQTLSADREVAEGARVSDLGVRLVDQSQSPVAGQVVRFSLTGDAVFASGASSGGTTAEVVTNAAGIAVAPPVLAGTAGAVVLTAAHGTGEEEITTTVSTIAVAAADAELGASIAVAFTQSANRVVLGVSVENTGAAPVEVRVKTRYGTKAFAAVGPGENVSNEFRTLLGSIPAGTVEVTVTGSDGRQNLLLSPYETVRATDLP